jgi:hypothetical protein
LPTREGNFDAARVFSFACATTLAPPGADAPAFKVSYRSGQHFGSMLDFYVREYNFDLHVNDKRTGVAVARANCSTDARGAVVAFTPIPLSN